MKITKFLNINIEPAPPELELEIEMQCREIMKSDDLDNIKDIAHIWSERNLIKIFLWLQC